MFARASPEARLSVIGSPPSRSKASRSRLGGRGGMPAPEPGRGKYADAERGRGRRADESRLSL